MIVSQFALSVIDLRLRRKLFQTILPIFQYYAGNLSDDCKPFPVFGNQKYKQLATHPIRAARCQPIH